MIDADRLGHEAYTPHSQTWRAVVEAFGEGVLQPTGEIDRKRLGGIVFSEPEARSKLNSIMHPRMADMIRERIGHFHHQGAEVVAVEAALLVEAGWDSLVDEIWVTCSPEEKVAERLRQRNGLPEVDIRSRIHSQLPLKGKAGDAFVWVQNYGTLDELREEVESLWSSRVKGKVG